MRRSRAAPLEEHVAPAGLAAEPDVGTEAVDEPRVAAARMAAPEAHDVAQVAARRRGA